MFLVGVDILGDKISEINVHSPGGLRSIQRLYDVDFSEPVIEAIERKVDYMTFYGRRFSNREIAVL